MHRAIILLAASAASLVLLAVEDASAQRRGGGGGGGGGGGFRAGGFGGGGGFRAGGFGGGGFRAGGGFRTAAVNPGRMSVGRSDFRPGRTRWQVGPDRWRPGWRRAWRRSYPYYWGGYDPGYDDWGWWGPAGVAIGAAAYPPYTPVTAAPADGNLCATPVRTCTLTNPAPIGVGCSCRTSGGRARGTVVDG